MQSLCQGVSRDFGDQLPSGSTVFVRSCRPLRKAVMGPAARHFLVSANVLLELHTFVFSLVANSSCELCSWRGNSLTKLIFSGRRATPRSDLIRQILAANVAWTRVSCKAVGDGVGNIEMVRRNRLAWVGRYVIVRSSLVQGNILKI